MKKFFALVMAMAVAVSLLSVCASAEDLVEILMSSENVTFSKVEREEKVDVADLDECLKTEAAAEKIPSNCTVTPGRITVMEQQNVCCDRDPFDVSYKVWSTINRTIMVFYRAEGEETWELMTCGLGDVIEARFPTAGSYVIAVAW